jgi:hypothetical protein
MTEVTASTQGDAVSRLIQLDARTLKLTGLKWTGKAYEDIRMVLSELDNARTFRDAILRGVNELLQMPEARSLPEAMQAKLFATVLNARAELDLRVEARNKAAQVKAP